MSPNDLTLSSFGEKIITTTIKEDFQENLASKNEEKHKKEMINMNNTKEKGG